MRMSLTLDIEDNTALNGNTSHLTISFCRQDISCWVVFGFFKNCSPIIIKSSSNLSKANEPSLKERHDVYIILCTARWHITGISVRILFMRISRFMAIFVQLVFIV